MATVLTDSAHYKAIANAIREKSGATEAYTPAEMAGVILQMETGGVDLDVLSNQAAAENILSGYAAYDSNGEVINGTAEQGVMLDALSNPATSQHVLSGYEAYDANGNKLSGTAFLTGGYAEFTLEAAKWNGTTYVLETNAWRIEEGQTPLMDLAFTSSVTNAQRVVQYGIIMPQFKTTATTDATTGEVTYVTKFMFSAGWTPEVDVKIAVVNITAVTLADPTGEEEPT